MARIGLDWGIVKVNMIDETVCDKVSLSLRQVSGTICPHLLAVGF